MVSEVVSPVALGMDVLRGYTGLEMGALNTVAPWQHQELKWVSPAPSYPCKKCFLSLVAVVVVAGFFFFVSFLFCFFLSLEREAERGRERESEPRT